MREFTITALQLDQENPRFSPTGSQSEAIQALLHDDPGKLLNLAQDIATTGQLNPLDNFGVVEEDGRPVVVEGNRRVAALKLLRRPSLAKSKTARDELNRLSAIGKGPNRVSCFVAGTREEARHWIELRHAGEMDGVGVRPWSSEQTNRFARSKGSQADKASRFADAVLKEFPDDHAMHADIAKARRERITTVGRLISDPVVARAFGVGFTDDDVVFHFDTQDLQEGFRKIWRDMAGGSVSEIKNKAQRQDYVLNSSGSVPAPSRRLATPRLPGSSTAAPPSKKTASKSKGGKPSKPETAIFEGLRLNHLSQRTQDVLRAAQRLKIDESVPVCAIMLRVIIEMVVTEVGVSKKWFQESEKLAKKIRKCLLTLDPSIEVPTRRDKTLDAAWTGSQSSAGGGIAVEQMNAYVHNFMASPTTADLRAHSLNFRPMLERLNAFVAANP